MALFHLPPEHKLFEQRLLKRVLTGNPSIEPGDAIAKVYVFSRVKVPTTRDGGIEVDIWGGIQRRGEDKRR